MKKHLLLIIPFLFATTAFAQVSTSGLNDVQEAELEMQAAKYREENKGNPSEDALESAKQWSELGAGVGDALVTCAEKLGMAVDEFSRTPVGQLTIAVIIWKVVGAEIVRKLAAIFFLIFGVWLWARYFRKLCVVQSIEYHENGKKKKVNHYDCTTHNTASVVIPTRWVMMFLLLGIVATSLIILLI